MKTILKYSYRLFQVQSMDVDPEALIKCTTITPGGVASSNPAATQEKVTVLIDGI